MFGFAGAVEVAIARKAAAIQACNRIMGMRRFLLEGGVRVKVVTGGRSFPEQLFRVSDKLLQTFANDIAAVDVAGLVDSKTVDPVQLTGFFFSIDGLWDGPHLDQLAIGPEFHENLIFGRTAERRAWVFEVKTPSLAWNHKPRHRHSP